MPNKDKQKINSSDKRFFPRLHTIFPIEFKLANENQPREQFQWFQGYTKNVGRGGICLETVSLKRDLIQRLDQEDTYIDLNIRVPFTPEPIKARAQYIWFNAEKEGEITKYFIGLKFVEISALHLNKLIYSARWFRLPVRLLVKILILLFCGLLLISYFGLKEQKKNETLMKKYVHLNERQRDQLKELEEVATRKEVVISIIKGQKEKEDVDTDLEAEYAKLLAREKIIADKIRLLSSQKDSIGKEILETMYAWLLNHQNRSTGLIKSFEGNVGVVKDWAFIYDQALAVNVFLLFENYTAAENILDFFKRNLSPDFQGYANAYYYDSEKVSEYTVHCGPNIWVGVAAMQYQDMTGSDQYLEIAETIAEWLIGFQEADPAGGLKGGPEFSWYATEHNLDAYAFFVMLSEKTGKQKYKIAAQKEFFWLKNYSMVPHDRDYQSPPVNRGLGDATVATDTYAWSLAAMGPERLEDLRMDPEAIMQYAQENCEVTVSYQRPSGNTVTVSGFDFSKIANMPRGGMISPEWTAQMIVSYQMLSKYFHKKNNMIKEIFYRERANHYLTELNKLIIASPSARGQGEGCLPYATLEQADTGHGWYTPMGGNTCSIAGTAYTIMAMKDFNPLMFKEKTGN